MTGIGGSRTGAGWTGSWQLLARARAELERAAGAGQERGWAGLEHGRGWLEEGWAGTWPGRCS